MLIVQMPQTTQSSAGNFTGICLVIKLLGYLLVWIRPEIEKVRVGMPPLSIPAGSQNNQGT